MNAQAQITSTTIELVEQGATLVDAFRQALDQHPAARGPRLLAAALVGLDHPRVQQRLREIVDEYEYGEGGFDARH